MDAAANDMQLDQIFHALADATRRKILGLIAERTLTVTEIAANFEMSLNAVSKHLKVLERAQLLKRTKDGRTYHCQTDPKPLAGAHDFLAFYQQFWSGNLDNLEIFFNKK